MDNSSVIILGFYFEPEIDALQEPFFNEHDENKTEQERSSSKVNHAVEEQWRGGKCEPSLTEQESRCCHEKASHYLNCNIRGGSSNFVPSKLEIFATND